MTIMDIAVTGSSGLVGTALMTKLRGDGHRAIALVRRQPNAGGDEIRWDPAGGTIDAASLEGIDGVIHLAGAGIGDKRWSEERKKVLVESRTKGTALLAETLAGLTKAPSAFVSGSAIGYYGSRGDEELTEASSKGAGFLADLVDKWELAAKPAQDAGIRVAFARTGIVMSKRGGALGKQLPLFKLGVGGRFGSGKQWQSWVSIDDEVAALVWLLTNDVAGPVNITAPNPVTNNEFTKTLGKVLGRPTLLPVPLIGPKLLFGAELVDEMLLASQRITGNTLTAAGYPWIYPDLEPALTDIVGRTKEMA